MIRNLKTGFKLLRYSYKCKMNLILLALFTVIGLGVEISSHGTNMLGGFYFMLSGMFAYQMIVSMDISGMVQSSAMKKRLQINLPVFVSTVLYIILYTVLVIERVILVHVNPQDKDMLMFNLFTIVIMLFIVFIFSAICYKYFVAGFIILLVACDLDDGLWIKGYVNGDEDQLKVYSVDHDAMIIERDGTEVQIAPRDVQFRSASLPARMMTNFAGPMNNFILSLVVFIILGFTLTGVPTNSNQLGQVNVGSVAAKAGLKANDRIIKVNNQKINNWTDLSTNISNKPNKTVSITYERGNKTYHTKLTPKAVERGHQKVGQIGIVEKQEKSLAARLKFGWQQFIQAGTLIFSVLGHMFTHGFSLNDLGGPVAIYGSIPGDARYS